MHINFSTVSENLARTFGDTECIVNVERDRRYSFREYHLLTNRIANMMRERLDLRKGDMWLNILLQRQPITAQLLHRFQGRVMCLLYQCHRQYGDPGQPV